MRFHLRNKEFVSLFIDAAGFKSGVAINKEQLVEIFAKDSLYKKELSVADEQYIGLHSSDVDEIFTHLLYSLGNVDRKHAAHGGIKLYHKYKGDVELAAMLNEIKKLYIKHSEKMFAKALADGSKKMDPSDFITEANQKFGAHGLIMSCELIEAYCEDQHCKLSGFRRFQWKDTVELENLFKSESLETKYGRFIDQRYINFLNQNNDKLGEMNWRKFEGLTAEYFIREGYEVELGPGRNDGGIDVRVWKENSLKEDPPLILVQCKRYKDKIDRTVVKALWADVEWEKAGSGLVVTTSSIAPGAKKDCIARGYNIKQANKDIISTWLKSMRTPGTGVFMGE